MPEFGDDRSLRKMVYLLLITVAVGAAVGRVLSTELVYEPSLHKSATDQSPPRGLWPSERPPPLPTFSSNDRSRWATVRALVDENTYAIGVREADGTNRSIWRESGWEAGWDTVDKVLDPDTNLFYSSKPPLLSTLIAGLYWLLKHLVGWTMAENIWSIVRTILLLVNVLPFLIYLFLLSVLVERFGRGDWSRIYVLAAACFATLVTPFLITLNNHTVATFSVLFALYPALAIVQAWHAGQQAPWYWFAGAGLFAAFAACNELPATSFLVFLALVLLMTNAAKTLLFFLPAAILPVAGYFVTNYLAIEQWIPVQAQFGSEWYMYEGSHWLPSPNKKGIDFASLHESRAMYAFHLLIGHHGLFSLTPMWLFAFAGMIVGLFLRKTKAEGTSEPPGVPYFLFPMTLLITAAVLAFYLVKSNNYGGWTAGLRWLMWISPLWLLCMLPILDWLGKSRLGRGFSALLLGLSVLSVSYPAWNPWRHPWLYNWMNAQGWIPY